MLFQTCKTFVSHAFVVVFSWIAAETDPEEKKSLNKGVWIEFKIVFFAHKKYSCSLIKLRLNHWCHMDYFNDVLTTYLGLERVNFVAVYAV